MKPFSLTPLAGIDNASERDDALQIGGQERRVYLRDAVNVVIEQGRTSMRPGRRLVTATPYADLWQSPLHGDVFARLGANWVKVNTADWSHTVLATGGEGACTHLVLNGLVLVACSAGLFQYDGQAAKRFTLDTPPAPAVFAGTGALEAGAYGVAVAWLRGSLESPLSPTLETSTTTDGTVVERFRLYDEASGTLRARNLVTDELALWDEVLQTGDYGQAWTASTDSWAMSRFAPFTFTSLAMIDGVAYGCNGQGVFALDGDAEAMTAELRTGALDMTGGVLCHPLEAHIEYELRGAAQFCVTTTQSGMPMTYAYPLNGRPTAGALTNARAEFGRGLRGRHFAYTLRLTGQRAYINDWSVLVAPSKRSI